MIAMIVEWCLTTTSNWLSTLTRVKRWQENHTLTAFVDHLASPAW